MKKCYVQVSGSFQKSPRSNNKKRECELLFLHHDHKTKETELRKVGTTRRGGKGKKLKASERSVPQEYEGVAPTMGNIRENQIKTKEGEKKYNLSEEGTSS